ncbi:hypothetical protein [Streptomyces sp. NPDC050485]|uniref:hypothetical protein n=1 Tax=Streptomyces sp. NPDC050485 TaxID=3365617 RepID=UPI0037BC09F6
MDTLQLGRALRSAGVDPSTYLLSPPGGDPPGTWLLGGGLALAGYDATQWWAFGGADLTPGHFGTLGAYGSEAEACEAFYRELTRPDGAPFAEAKAAHREQWERQQDEADQEAARRNPQAAELRGHWHRTWADREAQGEAAMTVAELDTALQQLGCRSNWALGGFDARPYSEGAAMAAPGADGTWWLGIIGERGDPASFLAAGLSEAEACKYILGNVLTGMGFAQRFTEAHRRAGGIRPGPLPPWPKPAP